MKRVFSNLFTALWSSLAIGVISGVLTMLMWLLGCIPGEIIGQHWTMGAYQFFWHNIIWGAVIALIVVIVLISLQGVMSDLYETDWEYRKKALKAWVAPLAVLPVLALGVLACFLLWMFQGQAIATVEEILILNPWDGDGVWVMSGVVGVIGGTCASFALYFFAMCIVYGVQACPHCGSLGWGGYSMVGEEINTYQGYRETTTQKEFRWQDSDHNSHSITYETPAYVAQETKVTTRDFRGRCRFCYNTNKKQTRDSISRDI